VRRVGAHIARELDADLELIGEVRSRNGVAGYLRSLLEAAASGLPVIRTREDPDEYDLVVLGSPVWGGTMSSPIRSYIFTHPEQLKRARFFTVMGGRGGENAIREMELACGAQPAQACVLTRRDVAKELYREKCASFVQSLKDELRAARGSSTLTHAA